MEYRKNYHKETYEEQRETYLDYYERNKEARSEYAKRWRKENRDKTRFYTSQKANHKISKKEWLKCKEYFYNECCYCGISIDIHYDIHGQDFHKDHYYPDGANDLSNCVPACRTCNIKKRNYPPEKFIAEANVTKERIRRINNWLSSDYKVFMKVNK